MEGTIPITHIRLIYDDSSDDEGKGHIRCNSLHVVSLILQKDLTDMLNQ